ncbi:MAG: hypothetical protein J5708_03820 [Bacteroidales bacterium]|nr:hypothetical protein [Bacteroidales bacterium]
MKNAKYIFVPFVIFALLVLLSCKKDELKLHKLEISSETVVKGATSVQITINYNYPTNLKNVDGYVSTMSAMTVANKATATIDGKTFVVRFQDLEANTTYYYQFEYSNGVDEIFTEVKSFTTNDYGLPTVTTNDVTNITAESATCGGNVTDDGGLTITACGVCWSTSQNPTINDSHSTDGTGTGTFTSSLSNLNSMTTYYIRAYATNSKGTSYGEQKAFKTSFVTPTGAIAGLFSVSLDTQVMFSQGNLQYQASTNTWRFAENQYDFIGDANANISSTYSGWIDLFGWGTSGYNHGAVCYQPYSTSNIDSDYYAYGNASYNLYDQTGKADWGYNAISNGGNTTNKWRTLTRDEWVYVFDIRSTESGNRYAKSQVYGINGVILLPDDWSTSTYSLNSTNTPGASYTTNTITAADWSTLEGAGAVFLPAAGWRNGTNVYGVGSYGNYWSASYYDSNYARFVSFYNEYLDPGCWDDRTWGRSVRLVCSAEN